jgi:integrase
MMKETSKFTTKKGKGSVCYRIPSKKGGKTIYTRDFYRRIARGGRQYYFRLGPEKRQAEVISNEIDEFLKDPRNGIEKAVLKFNPDSALKSDKTMISDIIRAHEKIEPILELRHNVAQNYRGRLMWVVRRVNAYRRRKSMEHSMPYEDSVEACSTTPISTLNERFISDLKLAVVNDVRSGLAGQADAKRHIMSVMSDAKSVFSEAAKAEYKTMGIDLPPNVEPFLRAKLFNRVSKKRYRLPEPEIIKAIFKHSEDLKIHPNAYRIFLLAVGSGLRRDEIQHLEWSWIEDNNGTPRIFLPVTEGFEQKGKGESYIELCPWAHKRLSSIGSKRDRGRVLAGTFTDGDRAGRYLCKWLRKFGLIRQKPIHELRMLYGSWVANRRGIFAAQKLLRHKDAQITSDHYADLIVDEEVLNLWEQVG